ncbi:50S ribosomal protein L1 [Elusimicrobiota bacterium]
MATTTKKRKEIEKLVDKNKLYQLAEAIDIAIKSAKSKFDESIEIHVALGVDPKKTNQQVRASVTLPNGTGKTKVIACVAKGEKVREAQEAGADHTGEMDLVTKIAGGWLGFDVLIATPDMMKDLAKLGKILGPKGLMPNPKTGTVTFDIARTINEIKKGRVDFKADGQGNVHGSVGKASFGSEKILANAAAFYSAVMHAKPSDFKGVYVKSLAVCSTHGPGVRINFNNIEQ